MNVARDCEHVSLGVDEDGPVSTTTHGTISLSPIVEIPGIFTANKPHCLIECRLGCPNQEVEMVAHEAIRMNFNLGGSYGLRNEREEEQPIKRGAEELITTRPLIHHVVPRARKLDPDWSRHRFLLSCLVVRGKR